MTDAELDEIEARARAAIPGPWHIMHDCAEGTFAGGWSIYQDRERPSLLAERRAWPEHVDESRATGDFLVRSREDVLALVAEVRRLRAGGACASAMDG